MTSARLNTSRTIEEALAVLEARFAALRVDDRRRAELARKIRILQDEIDARGEK